VAHAAAPSRVVALDKVAAHSLLAIGVTPVAAGAIGSYERLGIHVPSTTIEIGVPVEPNLELLQQISPDLIVTHFDMKRVEPLLRRIAPTFTMRIYRGDGSTYSHAASELERLAAALGRSADGEEYVRHVEQSILVNRQNLAAFGSRPVFVCQLGDNGRNVTVFGKNSIIDNVLARLGLTNAWRGATGLFGQANIGVEELAVVPDAELVYIDYEGEAGHALKRLGQSPFWNHLGFVKRNRLSPIKPFDVYGGLPTAARFSDLLVAALLNEGKDE